jgi:hypothetical protein
MYDVLRAQYRFPCPHDDGPRRVVTPSRFRRVDRLAGAVRPAVYRVEYGCECGDDHVGLLSAAELDYAPLGDHGSPAFRNLLTGRDEPLSGEMTDIVRFQVQRGNWPWRLYCAAEARVLPVSPSAFAMIAAAGRGRGVLGVALLCPRCRTVSLNLVTADHLDVPFYHDRVLRYVRRPFGDGRDLTLERFHEQLHSARFDAERAGLG